MYDTVGNGSFYNFYPPDETNPRGVLCSVQGVALNDAFAIYGKFNGYDVSKIKGIVFH